MAHLTMSPTWWWVWLVVCRRNILAMLVVVGVGMATMMRGGEGMGATTAEMQ